MGLLKDQGHAINPASIRRVFIWFHVNRNHSYDMSNTMLTNGMQN